MNSRMHSTGGINGRFGALTHGGVVRSGSVLHPEGGGRNAARGVPLACWGSGAAQRPGLVAAQPVGPIGVFQLMAACGGPGWTAVAKWSVVRSCRHPRDK